MPNKILVKSCKILLIISIILWSIVAVYFSFFQYANNANYLIVKILLFLGPILFAVMLYGIIQKIKIIYYLALPFTFVCTVLSITDNIGLYDIMSLIWHLLLFINLLMIWPQMEK